MKTPLRYNPVRLWLLLSTLVMALGVLAIVAWAEMSPTTVRIMLKGSVAPDGLGNLTLTKGDSAALQIGLFEKDGVTPVDVSDLVDLTLEIYSSFDSTTQLTEPVTLLGEDVNNSLTLEGWQAGTHHNAIIDLSSDQTNLAMTTRQTTLWGVIYGTLPGGERRTFGAGNITLRRGNAGGGGPGEALDPLYPTLSQINAYVAQVEAMQAEIAALEARIEELEAGEGGSGSGALTDNGVTLTDNGVTLTNNES